MVNCIREWMRLIVWKSGDFKKDVYIRKNVRNAKFDVII